jgi:pyruvate/2-oxoacid:ferredoxin oxidoreductase beta subunit
MKTTIPTEELMTSGHLACQGCGATLAMRFVLKALGQNTVYTIPACCWSVIDGPFPYSSLKVPIFHTAFETAASMASGLKAGLKIRGKDDANVIAWAGDGGTADIGIQALSGAAERNDDIFYICYDNEAYMNTGVQRSSSTPWGAATTTTPPPHHKKRPKKNVVDIMVAHKIPYVATANIGYPEDLIKKVEKGKNIRGTKYLQIYAPCPAGWRSDPSETIEICKLAMNTRYWPLFEVENGEYTLSRNIRKFVPIEDYLATQGRFRHLSETEVKEIQEFVEERWDEVCRLSDVENKFKEK